MFVDKVTISIKAGNGGDGYMSFRHEKYVDKGGPDGGDGGNGGSIIAVASNNQNTLARFRYEKSVKAEDGKGGFRQNKHGKRGADLELLLPVGTIITDEDGVIRADLTYDGQRVKIAEGGIGGFGNAHFVSSVRQAPKFAEKGEEGESYSAQLELKMIADVGLIGLPNAGKSTLLSVVTNAKPEIANYPFTTLKPNLGVAELSGSRSFLIADIPGLIEGASEGKGLGDEFLRHIERTTVLVHCIDGLSSDIAKDYTTIRSELAQYSQDLAQRPEVVVITKSELLDPDIVAMQTDLLKTHIKDSSMYVVSAQTHTGLKELLEKVYEYVTLAREQRSEDIADEVEVLKPNLQELEWKVEKIEEKVYRLIGRKIERFAMRTDTDNEEALRRLRDILRKKASFMS